MRELRSTLSVLDRLTNWDNPKSGTRTGDFEQIRESVRRHLNWLLNTRRSRGTELDDIPTLKGTILDYGLPDPASLSLDETAVQQEFAERIQEAIRLFEPRLTDVTVSPVTDGSTLAFRVRAVLDVEPAQERVLFRAVLESSTGRLSTQEIRPDA